MTLFPITKRTDMDLELTRDRFDTQQFDKETLERMKKQEMNFNRFNFTPSIISSVAVLGIIAYLVLKK